MLTEPRIEGDCVTGDGKTGLGWSIDIRYGGYRLLLNSPTSGSMIRSAEGHSNTRIGWQELHPEKDVNQTDLTGIPMLTALERRMRKI